MNERRKTAAVHILKGHSKAKLSRKKLTDTKVKTIIDGADKQTLSSEETIVDAKASHSSEASPKKAHEEESSNHEDFGDENDDRRKSLLFLG